MIDHKKNHEPRALADLARAETKINFDALVLVIGSDDKGATLTLERPAFERHHEHMHFGFERVQYAFIRIPEKHREAVAKALWQAPPSPDAGAFAHDLLTERLFYAMRDHLDVAMCRSILAADEVSWAGPTVEAQEALSKIAALLAFAPGVRITALERIAKCAAALFESGGIYDDSFWTAHEELANALDAIKNGGAHE